MRSLSKITVWKSFDIYQRFSNGIRSYTRWIFGFKIKVNRLSVSHFVDDCLNWTRLNEIHLFYCKKYSIFANKFYLADDFR